MCFWPNLACSSKCPSQSEYLSILLILGLDLRGVLQTFLPVPPIMASGDDDDPIIQEVCTSDHKGLKFYNSEDKHLSISTGE